jgi:hypothetical protein
MIQLVVAALVTAIPRISSRRVADANAECDDLPLVFYI